MLVFVVVVIGVAVWKTDAAVVNFYVGKLKSIVGIVIPSFEAGLIVGVDTIVGVFKDWILGVWIDEVNVWMLGIWIDGIRDLELVKGVKAKGLDDLILDVKRQEVNTTNTESMSFVNIFLWF